MLKSVKKIVFKCASMYIKAKRLVILHFDFIGSLKEWKKLRNDN